MHANPFDNLESTYEYICLLQRALVDAQSAIDEEIRSATAEGANRRLQAVQIVSYKLRSLDDHMTASRRLVNDLRTLRRILLGERQAASRVRSW